MTQLISFTQERLEPAPKPSEATSATEIRVAFFNYCGGGVPKKEIGLRLARKGFAEEKVTYYQGVTRSQKRGYRVRTETGINLMRLKAGSTGGSG